MFAHNDINLGLLRDRAFNLRWAAVPQDVIPLTAADPDFPCAPEIAAAISRFVKDRYFSYAPPEGYAFFRESVARFFQDQRKISCQPEHILSVDSAAFGIYAVCSALLKPGDEAIVFNPVDFLFKYSIEACQATAISLPVPINPAEILDYDLLEQLVTPRTKMICLCNPLNPTGKVFGKEELEKLAAIALRHNLVVLSDEIWSDIVFAPEQYTSIAAINDGIRNQTIIVTGYSKSYGLAGLRAGAVITTNAAYFEAILEHSRHRFTVHGSNVLAQVAVRAALDECGYWLEGFIQHLQAMRDLCVHALNQMPGISVYAPQGCYLLFPNITQTGLDAETMQQALFHEAKVAVVPGLPRWFGSGAAGHIRISFATSREILEESMTRIHQYLQTR